MKTTSYILSWLAIISISFIFTKHLYSISLSLTSNLFGINETPSTHEVVEDLKTCTYFWSHSSGTKEKSKEDQKIIEILMGDDVAPRKDFITSRALEVVNLDI